MSASFLVAARRTAVVPRNGAFAGLSLPELAAPVLRQAVADAGLHKTQIGEVVLSNAVGPGGNPARSLGLAAGLPEAVGGLTIDRQCAGGLDALILADALIRSGQQDVVIAGGVESYSRRPLRYRTFADDRAPEVYDQAPFTPWPDRDPKMAEAAEALARAQGIDKQAQDQWAIASHAKARASVEQIRQSEIHPLAGIDADPFARALTEKLCARAPALYGSVTNANTAVAADAAAFVVMVSERVAKERNAVRFLAGKTVGGTPDLPGLAPVAAIDASLGLAQVHRARISCAEIMEAYAVQAIACQQGADLPVEIVNPRGGALARGHPIGASGAILAVSLYHQLRVSSGIGLAAIAAAGGLGTAVVLAAE